MSFPDPTLIIDMAVAYRRSMILFAASELQVFTLIAGGASTAADLAARTSSQPAAMAGLLNACVAEGLLTRHGAEYRNTQAGEAFLVRGRPAYIGDGLKYAEDL